MWIQYFYSLKTYIKGAGVVHNNFVIKQARFLLVHPRALLLLEVIWLRKMNGFNFFPIIFEWRSTYNTLVINNNEDVSPFISNISLVYSLHLNLQLGRYF